MMRMTLILTLLIVAQGIRADYHSPVSDNNLEYMKNALKKNPNLVKDDEKEGISLLMYAAEKDHIEMAKLMLDHGAVVDFVDRYGRTPISYAAYDGAAKGVKFLLDNGADPTIASKDGFTPLHYAAMRGELDVVKLLLAHKKKPVKIDRLIPKRNETALQYSFYKSKLREKAEETAIFLIESGASLKVYNRLGLAPIHLAARRNAPNVVQAMLKKKVPVDLPDKRRKCTPLYYAVNYQQYHTEAVVKVLLENGAKVDEKIMKLAESKDNNKIIDLLDKYKK